MIVESTRNGHRPAYAEYFSDLLSDSEIRFISETSKSRLMMRGLVVQRLLLSTADDYLLFALILSVLRVVLRLRTHLVVIRAEHAIDRSGPKAHIRRVLYRLLRVLPLVNSVSIMPHMIEPRLAKLTNGSIYDPAFFELDDLEEDLYRARGEGLPEGRMPSGVVFLGVLSEARNIRTFLSIFGPRAEVDARVYGRRAANLPESVLAETGYVTVQEGHLDNATFVRILGSAPSVWCAFRPDYDNFSGVFCNAVRLGTPVWVTHGSRLARFALMQGGQEVCRLHAGEQSFVLYRRIAVNLARIRKVNESALK